MDHGLEVDWEAFQMLSGRDPYPKDHGLEIDWEVFQMLKENPDQTPQVGPTHGWLWEPEKPYAIDHGLVVDWAVFQMLGDTRPCPKDHSLEIDWEAFKMLGSEGQTTPQVGRTHGWLWQ